MNHLLVLISYLVDAERGGSYFIVQVEHSCNRLCHSCHIYYAALEQNSF